MRHCIALLGVGVLWASQSVVGAQSRALPAEPGVRAAKIDFEIGKPDGAKRDSTRFGYISALTLDRNGQFYVVDGTHPGIRVFSASGHYEFTIGTAGTKFGEFTNPAGIAIAPDGMLWVRDMNARLLGIFALTAPTGKFVREVKSPEGGAYGPVDRIHWDSAGNVADFKYGNRKPGESWTMIRSFLDARGNIVSCDTAPIGKEDSLGLWRIPLPTGGVSRQPLEFEAERIQAFGGPGLAAYAMNTNYFVSLVDEHGKRIAMLHRAVKSAPISSGERASAIKHIERIAAQHRIPMTPSAIAAMVPKVKPVISEMGFDLDGRLWVTHAHGAGLAYVADVYDSTGKWLEERQWPNDVTMSFLAVHNDGGVAIRRDSTGRENIVHLRW